MSMTLTGEMLRASLRPLVERVAQSETMTPDEADEMLANCALLATLLDQSWSRVEGMVSRGIERENLLAALRELTDLLDQCAAAFGDVRAKAALMNLDPKSWAGCE